MYEEASDNTSKVNGKSNLVSNSTSSKKNLGADTDFGGNEIFCGYADFELLVGHLREDVH